MSGDELQRPRQFEHENAWLKRALAEGMLDTRISKEQNAKNGGAAAEAPSRGPDQRGLAETNLGSMHAEGNQKGDETVRASPLCASSFEAEHPGLPRANTEKERGHRSGDLNGKPGPARPATRPNPAVGPRRCRHGIGNRRTSDPPSHFRPAGERGAGLPEPAFAHCVWHSPLHWPPDGYQGYSPTRWIEVTAVAERFDIERAWDHLISNEGGMILPGLAVVLAAIRYPELGARARERPRSRCRRHSNGKTPVWPIN